MSQKKIFHQNFAADRVGLPPKERTDPHGLLEGSRSEQLDRISSTEQLAFSSQLGPGGLSKRKKREDDWEEDDDEGRKRRKRGRNFEDEERWEGAIEEDGKRNEEKRPKMRMFGLGLQCKTMEKVLRPLPPRPGLPSTAKKIELTQEKTGKWNQENFLKISKLNEPLHNEVLFIIIL